MTSPEFIFNSPSIESSNELLPDPTGPIIVNSLPGSKDSVISYKVSYVISIDDRNGSRVVLSSLSSLFSLAAFDFQLVESPTSYKAASPWVLLYVES